MSRRRPGFSATAIVTLALGIGVNVAMFSVVNAVLIRRLPFPAPDRLVNVGEASMSDPRLGAFNRWDACSTRMTSLLKKELFHVQPHDPWTLAGAALTFFVVGLTACWIPARRSARVDPVAVLKSE